MHKIMSHFCLLALVYVGTAPDLHVCGNKFLQNRISVNFEMKESVCCIYFYLNMIFNILLSCLLSLCMRLKGLCFSIGIFYKFQT